LSEGHTKCEIKSAHNSDISSLPEVKKKTFSEGKGIQQRRWILGRTNKQKISENMWTPYMRVRRKCEERLNDKCFNSLFCRANILPATRNLFKKEVTLNYEICSYLAVNTLHLEYKTKLLKAAQGNNRCSF
jgi:hypothetical protein